MRADAFNLHKSVGLTILALMTLRLLWRWRHPAPALPAMPALAGAAGACEPLRCCTSALFVQPLAGYLGSVYSGYPVKFFGMTLPAWGRADASLKEFFSAVHSVNSWVLAAAVTLHVAAALKHAFVDRDGLLSRMGLGIAAK